MYLCSSVQNTVSTALLSNIVPEKAASDEDADRAHAMARAKLTQLKVDFEIKEVNLSLTQQGKSGKVSFPLVMGGQGGALRPKKCPISRGSE